MRMISASRIALLLVMCAVVSVPLTARAGGLSDRLQQGVANLLTSPPEDHRVQVETLVPGSRRLTESYGEDPLQALDVYLPPHATDAPILVMVHGGGWKEGDKGEPHVVVNKLKRWLPQGFIVISVNTRLLPQAMAYEQAEDLAKAMKWIQGHARTWGGRSDKIILMGHSSGGHLVALLSSKPSMVGKPWAGTVALDTSALHIPSKMRKSHLPFYDAAFGSDPGYWTKASPMNQWTAKAVPMMLVCSSQRPDKPCSEAKEFQKQAAHAGREMIVSPQNLSHAEINDTLGESNAYTGAVETFIMRQLAGR